MHEDLGPKGIARREDDPTEYRVNLVFFAILAAVFFYLSIAALFGFWPFAASPAG
jgi:hypothetical protein